MSKKTKNFHILAIIRDKKAYSKHQWKGRLKESIIPVLLGLIIWTGAGIGECIRQLKIVDIGQPLQSTPITGTALDADDIGLTCREVEPSF